MTKRIYVFIVLLAALLVSANTYAQDDFSEGKGTAESPFLIKNVKDLETLNEWANNGITYGIYFKLANDIVDTPFKGMIATTGVFEGVFDGDNHCVAVETDFPELNCVGFIGFMLGATVRNLQVQGNVTGNLYVGGVVGQAANGSTIENVINYATVNASMFGGGVAGQIITQEDKKPCIARQLANYGTINGKYIGGVIGDMGQQVGNVVERIANYGHINGDKKSGGLIGNARPYDYVYYGFNFGTTENDKPQGCIGNTISTTIGELYYDAQIFDIAKANELQSITTEDLIGESFMNVDQDNGFYFDHWVYEDNMYPRLNMNGMENLTIPVLYASPIVLAQGNTLNNITRPFTVGTANGVTWTSENGKVLFSGCNAVPTGDGEDVITATLNGVSRSFRVKVDYTAGIDDVSASDVNTVETAGGAVIITLSDNADVQIVNVAGHAVMNANLAAGVHTYAMPAGIYIVRISNNTYKVCVK